MTKKNKQNKGAQKQQIVQKQDDQQQQIVQKQDDQQQQIVEDDQEENIEQENNGQEQIVQKQGDQQQEIVQDDQEEKIEQENNGQEQIDQDQQPVVHKQDDQKIDQTIDKLKMDSGNEEVLLNSTLMVKLIEKKLKPQTIPGISTKTIDQLKMDFGNEEALLNSTLNLVKLIEKKLKPQTIPGISIEKIDHIIDKLKTSQENVRISRNSSTTAAAVYHIIANGYIKNDDRWETDKYSVKQTIHDRINQLEAIKTLTPDLINKMFIDTVNNKALSQDTTHESLKAEFIKAFNDTYQNIISADKKEYVNKELGKVFDSLMNYICIDDQSKQITVHKENFDVSASDTIKAFLIQFAKFVLTAGILTIIEAIKGESVFLPSAQEEKNRAKSFVEQKASEAIDPDVMKLIAV